MNGDADRCGRARARAARYARGRGAGRRRRTRSAGASSTSSWIARSSSQEARARSIVVGQDQVERAFLRVRAEYPGAHFDDLLAQERLSQAELKARLADQLTIERLFEAAGVPASAGLRRGGGALLRRPRGGVRGAGAGARAPGGRARTKEEALAVREKLRRNPQTFAEVARRSSIAPEGKAGGDLGYIGRGSGFPEVFDVTFTLPLNRVSDVTPSPYGFHVFKVVDRRPAAAAHARRGAGRDRREARPREARPARRRIT